MHAYLLVGQNPDQKIAELVKKLRATPLEFAVSKIDDIRKLNSFTALTAGSPQAMILKNIDEATPEALNALLKNLEEPGENTYYILTCTNLSQVLPTIKSRCEIINAKWQMLNAKLQSKEQEKFIKLNISEKFKFLDKIKIREEALEFTRNLLISLHPQIIREAQNIKICQHVFNNLKANGNINIQLTYLAINQI